MQYLHKSYYKKKLQALNLQQVFQELWVELLI